MEQHLEVTRETTGMRLQLCVEGGVRDEPPVSCRGIVISSDQLTQLSPGPTPCRSELLSVRKLGEVLASCLWFTEDRLRKFGPTVALGEPLDPAYLGDPVRLNPAG